MNIAKEPEFNLKMVVDNLRRCDENIKIFSAEVEKQRQQKIDLEILKRELEQEIKAKETNA